MRPSSVVELAIAPAGLVASPRSGTILPTYLLVSFGSGIGKATRRDAVPMLEAGHQTSPTGLERSHA